MLLAANLGDNKFETVLIEIDNDLINLKNEYFDKYKQDNQKYVKFDDFGELVEIELYGIRPRKYRTFSALFCLNPDSYKLDPVKFKEICVGLNNYGIDNYSEKNNMNSQKLKFEEIVQNLMNSEIANLFIERIFFF